MAWEEFFAGLGALVALVWIFALVALAALVVYLVFYIQMIVAAYRMGRSGWWIYLVCLFISPLHLVAFIAWHVHLKQNPWKISEGVVM